MERIIEKNDVDISALFKWNKPVEIKDFITGDKATIFIRLLGDADLGKARAHGYRKSGEYRKLLKMSGSDERVTLLAEIEDFSDIAVLLQAIILLRIGDYYQTAIKTVDLREPKEPDDDDVEKWEKYQIAVDEYPKKFEKLVEDSVEKLRERDMKELESLTKDKIYLVYEQEVINRISQEKLNNAFFDVCLFYACYKDNKFKEQVFKSVEEVENIHPKLKEFLIAEYKKLEVGTDFLKLLPGVTP